MLLLGLAGLVPHLANAQTTAPTSSPTSLVADPSPGTPGMWSFCMFVSWFVASPCLLAHSTSSCSSEDSDDPDVGSNWCKVSTVWIQSQTLTSCEFSR